MASAAYQEARLAVAKESIASVRSIIRLRNLFSEAVPMILSWSKVRSATTISACWRAETSASIALALPEMDAQVAVRAVLNDSREVSYDLAGMRPGERVLSGLWEGLLSVLTLRLLLLPEVLLPWPRQCQ